jgi:DUF1009 family protein
VQRLVVIAFRGETDRALQRLADRTDWLYLGQLARMRELVRAAAVPYAVLAGSLTPTSLFRLRFDRPALDVMARIKERNAHTLFGAFVDELASLGVRVLPAYRFMEKAMPAPGPIAGRAPTPAEWDDIRLGLRVAKATSGLDIGQTVAIKQGTILAVEAFEGTDATILRAGKLGGPGIVIVKVAKPGHDMRFDIPVVGPRTLKNLRRVRAAVLAVEAHRAILLEREALARAAQAQGLAFLAVEAGSAAPNGKEPLP